MNMYNKIDLLKKEIEQVIAEATKERDIAVALSSRRISKEQENINIANARLKETINTIRNSTQVISTIDFKYLFEKYIHRFCYNTWPMRVAEALANDSGYFTNKLTAESITVVKMRDYFILKSQIPSGATYQNVYNGLVKVCQVYGLTWNKRNAGILINA